jgi:hypothetical protein
MFFLTNEKLAWLSIPKSASSSMNEILGNQLGWQRKDLRDPTVDLDKLEFFGCLRNPDDRHTSGIAEYLLQNNITGVLDDYPEMVVGSILDHHTWTIQMSFPQAILDRCTFFVIDHPQSPWPNHLVSWLSNRGVELPGPIPWLNASQDSDDATLKQRIEEIKQSFPTYHRWLTNWTLAQDISLYNKHIEVQNELAHR